MEEDIKFIKYYMKQYFYEDISIKDDFKFEEAIKNLLDRYKQLEEDNNKLSKMLCLCTPEVPQNNHDKYISYVDIVKKLVDSIPKSKVKEKIEKINERIKQLEKDSRYCTCKVECRLMSDEIYTLRRIRDTLQELIKEE